MFKTPVLNKKAVPIKVKINAISPCIEFEALIVKIEKIIIFTEKLKNKISKILLMI